MADDTGQETPPLVVFRPKRRCERCGLINTDNAARCRRCRASFAGVDRGAESERLVERNRTRRVVSVLVAVALVAGLAAAGYLLYDRFLASERYAREFRALSSDVLSLERGARSDAGEVARALDDTEVKSVLADQAPIWLDRLGKCDALRARLDALVPPGPDDAREFMRAGDRIALVKAVSTEMAGAGAARDVARGRVAAARLAPVRRE